MSHGSHERSDLPTRRAKILRRSIRCLFLSFSRIYLYFRLRFAFRFASRQRPKNGDFEVAILAEGRDLDLDSLETSLRGQARDERAALVATLGSGY